MNIAFLAAPEGTEQIELTEPWQAVLATGDRPSLLSTSPGSLQAFRHLDRGDTFPVDGTVAEADPGEYGALVLPGGVANPDALRLDADAVAFVRAFFDAGKPVAAICHAPWVLVEAGVVDGRVLTSWPSLRTDITNAGGRWVDVPVQVCDHGPNLLITSRKPDDLPDFTHTFTEVFAKV
ncbi:type 1 glutamine amidotransferase [Streptomyces roseirectus]|uniref:Type 1 glutamine amidotransferase n=1 Tax=Streptomyces roseirectus TaxID=2768066 RepID=A0A7H0INN4_9ACTN|nr:type 1 glutamine amidotransferase domain-containing protein [Streptomyces roseirectus]QNP74400.1 type 1 glutamine amidotransferase [Streptomyces roseirectus]